MESKKANGGYSEAEQLFSGVDDGSKCVYFNLDLNYVTLCSTHAKPQFGEHRSNKFALQRLWDTEKNTIIGLWSFSLTKRIVFTRDIFDSWLSEVLCTGGMNIQDSVRVLVSTSIITKGNFTLHTRENLM